MRNYVEMSKGIYSYNLVCSFFIQLFSVLVVHFSDSFWHGNKAFVKDGSWNEIVLPLVFFNLLYSRCAGVKTCFHLCLYQNKNFSFVSHSCRLCSTCVTLVSFMQHLCLTRVVRVSLVPFMYHSRLIRVACFAPVSHSCHSRHTCVARVQY